MSRYRNALLVFALMFTLVACGGEQEPAASETAPQTTGESAAAKTDATSTDADDAATPTAKSDIELPTDVIDEQVAALIWIDAADITPELLEATAERMLASVDGANAEQLRSQFREQFLNVFTDFHARYSEAGGRGMLFGLTPPGVRPDTATGQPAAFMLMNVEPGSDPAALAASFGALDENAAAEMAAARMEQVAPGWLAVLPADEAGETFYQPTTGDAATTQRMQDLLGESVGPIRVAVVVTDELQRLMPTMDQARQIGGPQGAIMAMVSQVTHAALGLDLGGTPRLALAARFRDEAAAERATMMLDGLVQSLKASIAMQAPPNADQQQIAEMQNAFGALSPTRDGQTLRIELRGEAAATLAGGVLLPSVMQARAAAQRTMSAANLRTLYQAAMVYAIANDDQFPPDVKALVMDGSVAADVVVNPTVSDAEPPADQSIQQQAAWAEANSDYVITIWGRSTAAVSADEVAGHERIEPGMPSATILFGDGSVRTFPIDIARQIIEAGRMPRQQ
jgi:hypothetical protein